MVGSLPQIDAERRYTRAETAEILGIHRNTLKRYTDKGLIRMTFMKKTLKGFYRGADIEKFYRATV